MIRETLSDFNCKGLDQLEGGQSANHPIFVRQRPYKLSIPGWETLFLILFLFTTYSYSQNRAIDSLALLVNNAKDDTTKVIRLNNLCQEYMFVSKNDTAAYFAKRSLALSQTLDFKRGISTAYNKLGNIFLNKEDYKSALENHMAALKIRKILGDKGAIDASYNNLGLVYYHLGNYTESLKSHFAALEIEKALGQKNYIIDSYSNIGLVYTELRDYPTAMKYYTDALKLGLETNDKKELANIYNNIGNLYVSQGNYAEALKNHFSSLKVKLERGDQNGAGTSYITIGMIYAYQGNYAAALKNCFESMKIAKEIGNKKMLGDSYLDIGGIYMEEHNYGEAIKNYQDALKIKTELADKNGVADCYNNIGLIYNRQNNNVSALKNFLSALKIRTEIADTQGVATSFNSIGQIYATENNLDSAFANLFRGLKLFQIIGDKKDISISYNNIGRLYWRSNQPILAEQYCINALDISKKIGSKDIIRDSYQNLSLIYSTKNDYTNAYKYLDLYTQTNDSIFSKNSTRQIAEMKTRFETEEKEHQIKLLNSDNEIKALQISEQKHQLINHRILLASIISVVIFIALLSWLLISRNRSKQQEKYKSEMLHQQELRTRVIIETQEGERKRIAQDLHDGIGQNLAAAKMSFETYATQLPNATSDQKLIFTAIESILEDTQNEVRALSHSMMPKALQERELGDAVSDLLEQTFLNSKIKYSFSKDLPPDIPENVQICLFRVLQELLNNILKHSEATEVAVETLKYQNNIIMMVEDNGKGIPEEVKSDGIGLQSISARVHSLNGSFKIEPGPSKGTIATIRIQL